MDELYSDKRLFYHNRKYQERKNNSAKTSIFMLRQSFHHQAHSRKSCRDTTVRIHNQGQHNLCCEKDYFCRDRQKIKEVNSLSQQDVEKQHKKNGNKETSCYDIIKSYKQNLCHDKEVFYRDNKSKGMIKFCRNKRKVGRNRN